MTWVGLNAFGLDSILFRLFSEIEACPFEKKTAL